VLYSQFILNEFSSSNWRVSLYCMPTPGNVDLLSGLARFGQDLKRTTLPDRTFPR